MPRPDRIFVDGGIHHVYDHLGRGERVFDEEVEANVFVSLLREIAERYGLNDEDRCPSGQRKDRGCRIQRGFQRS